MESLASALEMNRKILAEWLSALKQMQETRPVVVDGVTYGDEADLIEAFLENVPYAIQINPGAIILQLTGGGPSIDWIILTMGGSLFYTALLGSDWFQPRKAYLEQDDVLWDFAKILLEYLMVA